MHTTRLATLLGISLALAARTTAQCTNQWTAGPGATGPNGPVAATTMWDADGAGPLPPRLVVGGTFTAVGSSPASNIAAFDFGTGTWSTLGPGLPGGGGVLALATLPNGDLVAGGDFGIGSIARWNGATWLPLGGGMNAPVYCLACLPNSDLVAGGYFSTAGGVAASGIARWNGTTWAGLGTGVSGSLVSPHVNALCVLANGDLVAGGDFGLAGGVLVDNIARWNGSSWSAVGSGLPGGEVRTVIAARNGDLVVGGSGSLGPIPVVSGFTARWNGSTWSGFGPPALGVMLSSWVFALAELPDGDLVVGGSWTSSHGPALDNIARYDGSSWSAVGQGLNDTVLSLAATAAGDVFAGGLFTTTGAVPVGPFAQLTTSCPANVLSSGAGCTGSGGPNVLAAISMPWIGATFHARATGMPPNALAVVVHGLASQSLSLASLLPSAAGCALLVTPDLLTVAIPTAGVVSAQLAIPDLVALAGQSISQQVVSLELGALGAITAATSTNALSLTLGSL